MNNLSPIRSFRNDVAELNKFFARHDGYALSEVEGDSLSVVITLTAYDNDKEVAQRRVYFRKADLLNKLLRADVSDYTVRHFGIVPAYILDVIEEQRYDRYHQTFDPSDQRTGLYTQQWLTVFTALGYRKETLETSDVKKS